jgi:acyl carrier protein
MKIQSWTPARFKEMLDEAVQTEYGYIPTSSDVVKELSLDSLALLSLFTLVEDNLETEIDPSDLSDLLLGKSWDELKNNLLVALKENGYLVIEDEDENT